MSRAWVFDAPHYDRLNESRKVWLGRPLLTISGPGDLRTVLDAGCGMGFFSAYLSSAGLQATGVVSEDHVGFAKMYTTTSLPDHDDFRENLLHRRRRTMLVASRGTLSSPLLQPVPEPQPRRPDIWRRGIATLLRVAG